MVFPVNNEAECVSTVALDSLSTRINHWQCEALHKFTPST